MAASQDHITTSTPMGATLTEGGATFRVWAPEPCTYMWPSTAAREVPSPANELVKEPATGHWTGFFPGVLDGARYRYWVEGPGGKGLKRDL
jgi:1,4-alpha-glucan branching enzyme